MPTFDDIFGQAAAVEALRRAYLADRLPHGLLFAGPVGVGKATTAAALASLWLCDKPKEDRPCGKCEGCRTFAGGSHPDYHVITKELIRLYDRDGKSKGVNLSIDVIRPELVARASLKAAMGRGKVFVVERTELMSTAAQNAMLKTLEEPAGRALIVLLTDDPDSLLPTVRSRCQMFRFAALGPVLVREQLELRGIDPPLAADAAQLAEGSLGVALKWIEDGVIDPARELRVRLDGLLAGGGADLTGWFRAVAEAYAEKQLERDELTSKDQANREGLALYLRLAATYFRARLAATDDPDDMERACAAIDAISRAGVYLDANVNVTILFQQLTLKLQREFALPG